MVSGVGANYTLSANPAAENEGVVVEDVEAAHQAAVERGDLTQEQADERLEAWKKNQTEGLKAREDFLKRDIEDVQAELKAWVEAGEITQEQADERLEGFRAWENSRKTDVVTDSQ